MEAASKINSSVSYKIGYGFARPSQGFESLLVWMLSPFFIIVKQLWPIFLFVLSATFLLFLYVGLPILCIWALLTFPVQAIAVLLFFIVFK